MAAAAAAQGGSSPAAVGGERDLSQLPTGPGRQSLPYNCGQTVTAGE